MTPLRYDPYKIFTDSVTPVGLYARKKWLGLEGDPEWQRSFNNTTALLLEGWSQNGSWGGSLIRTVKRLFGLHLTVRHPTGDIDRALDWLLDQTTKTDIDNVPDLAPGDLNGLPFVPGKPRFLYTGAALFLAAIFGRENSAVVMEQYQDLAQQIVRKAYHQGDHGDMTNVLRALAVHPEYTQSPATIFIVELLSGIQDSSGMWPGTIPFYKTVNALAHLDLPKAYMQLEKAFTLLSKTQNSDGTWGNSEKEWNTFLVVHAMRNKRML